MRPDSCSVVGSAEVEPLASGSVVAGAPVVSVVSVVGPPALASESPSGRSVQAVTTRRASERVRIDMS